MADVSRQKRGANSLRNNPPGAAAAPLSREGVAEPASRAGATSGPRVRAARWRWLVVLALIFSDTLLAFTVWGAAAVLQSVWGRGPISEIAAASVAVNAVVWIGMRALLGLYPGFGLGQVEELRRQTHAVVVTLAATAIFALAFQIGDSLSRLLLGLGFLGLLLLAPLLRYFMKRGMRRVGLWGKQVAILGADETAARLVRALQREWGLGFRPVAVYDDGPAPAGGELEGVPYGGTLTNAVNLARKQEVDTALVAMTRAHTDRWMASVTRASHSFRYVIVVPHLAEVATSGAIARDLAGTLGVELKHNLLNPWARFAKRALDLLGVVVGGLLVSPLLLCIVALVKLSSPGPAFYKQRRPGAGGEHFDCWKFRTMRADAESVLTKILQTNPDLRAEWEADHKLRDDPRITHVGRFLRKTSLDELPQLWNVLRGEMSLVGPRPIVDEEIPKYGEAYGLYQQMRPGITGLWQVSGRGDIDYEERVAMAAYYVRNWSLWLDLVILARTVGSAIFGRGAY
jgi:Undecaprenyl-phosphate galactose phosphotransferase WbaP